MESYSATARTAPARLSNYCQILEDTFQIEGSGRRAPQRLRRYEADKSLKYLNTELEYAARATPPPTPATPGPPAR